MFKHYSCRCSKRNWVGGKYGDATRKQKPRENLNSRLLAFIVNVTNYSNDLIVSSPELSIFRLLHLNLMTTSTPSSRVRNPGWIRED
jgi:hypothetical protein